MERAYKIEYRAKQAVKHTAASKLKGAVRAAVVRVALREYDEAVITCNDEIVACVFTNREGRKVTQGLRIFRMDLMKE